MAEYTKPIPEPDPHSAPFWEGAKQGKLMLPRCVQCNRVHWYPRLICPHCHSTDIEWIEGSGLFSLVTDPSSRVEADFLLTGNVPALYGDYRQWLTENT